MIIQLHTVTVCTGTEVILQYIEMKRGPVERDRPFREGFASQMCIDVRSSFPGHDVLHKLHVRVIQLPASDLLREHTVQDFMYHVDRETNHHCWRVARRSQERVDVFSSCALLALPLPYMTHP